MFRLNLQQTVILAWLLAEERQAGLLEANWGLSVPHKIKCGILAYYDIFFLELTNI